MIRYIYEPLLLKDSIDKQLIIEVDDGTIIDNESILYEEFSLSESLCSEESLRFGSCEASSVQFKVSRIYNNLKNHWITISMVLDGRADSKIQIGKYKVYSDKITSDRKWREIQAYDAMYDILNANVANWYNSLTFPLILINFRKSFFDFLGVAEESAILPNDGIIVEKTLEVNIDGVLSGKDIITAICEINGVFGHITRDNKFKYVKLDSQNTIPYPRNNLFPSNTLYPSSHVSNNGVYYVQHYTSCIYEEFTSQKPTRLTLQANSEDPCEIIGSDDTNTYQIVGNFILYNKSSADLQTIGRNLFENIKDVDYIPYTCNAFYGNFCAEVGDNVIILTTEDMIKSYILTRTLTGIQGLHDYFTAEGTEKCETEINGIQSSFRGISDRYHRLVNSIDELSSEIYEYNPTTGTQISRITQNSDSIALEVQRAKDEESDLSSRIEVLPSNIDLSVSNNDDNANISLVITKEDGSIITTTAKNIKFNGVVTFSDLDGTSGKTTVIDGGNIATNSILATSINVDGLEVKEGNFTNKFQVKIPTNKYTAGYPKYFYINLDENDEEMTIGLITDIPDGTIVSTVDNIYTKFMEGVMKVCSDHNGVEKEIIKVQAMTGVWSNVHKITCQEHVDIIGTLFTDRISSRNNQPTDTVYLNGVLEPSAISTTGSMSIKDTNKNVFIQEDKENFLAKIPSKRFLNKYLYLELSADSSSTKYGVISKDILDGKNVPGDKSVYQIVSDGKIAIIGGYNTEILSVTRDVTIPSTPKHILSIEGLEFWKDGDHLRTDSGIRCKAFAIPDADDPKGEKKKFAVTSNGNVTLAGGIAAEGSISANAFQNSSGTATITSEGTAEFQGGISAGNLKRGEYKFTVASTSPGSVYNRTVSFDTPFKDTPIVTISPQTSRPDLISSFSVGSITKADFEICCVFNTTANISMDFEWIALS